MLNTYVDLRSASMWLYQRDTFTYSDDGTDERAANTERSSFEAWYLKKGTRFKHINRSI